MIRPTAVRLLQTCSCGCSFSLRLLHGAATCAAVYFCASLTANAIELLSCCQVYCYNTATAAPWRTSVHCHCLVLLLSHLQPWATCFDLVIM